MIVRYIKFNDLILSHLDSNRLLEIELLTSTKIFIDLDHIQIIGEASNSRQARLLIQHFILISSINADFKPFILNQKENRSEMFNWQQIGYHTIKKALSTLNLFFN